MPVFLSPIRRLLSFLNERRRCWSLPRRSLLLLPSSSSSLILWRVEAVVVFASRSRSSPYNGCRSRSASRLRRRRIWMNRTPFGGGGWSTTGESPDVDRVMFVVGRRPPCALGSTAALMRRRPEGEEVGGGRRRRRRMAAAAVGAGKDDAGEDHCCLLVLLSVSCGIVVLVHNLQATEAGEDCRRILSLFSDTASLEVLLDLEAGLVVGLFFISSSTIWWP